jgi:hypothetical protein
MQWQKLKSKAICFSTTGSNSNSHEDCCLLGCRNVFMFQRTKLPPTPGQCSRGQSCLQHQGSVPEDKAASNTRAATLKTEVQLHQTTWHHIPQDKILTHEIPTMPHQVRATVRNKKCIRFEVLARATLLRQFQSDNLALCRQQSIILDST